MVSKNKGIDHPELTLDMVKERAISGIAVLVGRTAFLKMITFIIWGIIVAYLSETEVGIFFVVTAFVGFLRYFSDVGLAAALIQKKTAVTENELRSTFTIQQILVLSVIVIAYFLTPYLMRYYSLEGDAVFLFYSLLFAFFLSSLKTIPSILLERELKFSKLVIPEIVEELTYNTVVLILAVSGFGLMSYTYAILLRSVVGVLVLYSIQPWAPRISFDIDSMKHLFRFGIPYQLNSFIATLKDDGLTAFLGGVIGVAGVGYIGWAQRIVTLPLRFIMDNVLRVSFPAFSRMQDDPEALGRAVTKSMKFLTLTTFPVIFGLIAVVPILVRIIPRYDQWQPALLPLVLLSVNSLFAVSTTQLTNLVIALGKMKLVFSFMVMWASLSWLLIPSLGAAYGVNGAALGYAIVAMSSTVVIYIVRKFVHFSILNSIIKPFIAAVIMFICVITIRSFLPFNLVGIVVMIIIGILSYTFAVYFILGQTVIDDAKTFSKALFKRE